MNCKTSIINKNLKDSLHLKLPKIKTKNNIALISDFYGNYYLHDDNNIHMMRKG